MIPMNDAVWFRGISLDSEVAARFLQNTPKGIDRRTITELYVSAI
jgi:hypothetical protein